MHNQCVISQLPVDSTSKYFTIQTLLHDWLLQKSEQTILVCKSLFFFMCSSKDVFVFWHSFLVSFTPSLSFTLSPSFFSVCCWQRMVTTARGWIFNRFVSGCTMGGGIVVNIITYRSLWLHFPRPCQTGAITHSSQAHHQHTYTHILFWWLAVTPPVDTVSLCSNVLTSLYSGCSDQLLHLQIWSLCMDVIPTYSL